MIKKVLAQRLSICGADGTIESHRLAMVDFRIDNGRIVRFSVRPFVQEEPAVTYVDGELSIICGADGTISVVPGIFR